MVPNPNVIDSLILRCPQSPGAGHVIYEEGDALIFQKIGADLAKEPRHDAITKSTIIGLLAAFSPFFLGGHCEWRGPKLRNKEESWSRLKVHASVYFIGRD